MGVEPITGRDIFSRVVYGARVSLLIALAATAVSVVIGTVIGMVAGFFGGWIDAILSRLMDMFLAFPILRVRASPCPASSPTRPSGSPARRCG